MKKKSTATLLAMFLGALGVHKFYTGKTGLGILYLVMCITLIFSWLAVILAFIDMIVLITLTDAEFDAKYNA